MTKLAVVDIGTNSIHMVLADIESDGSYKILDWEMGLFARSVYLKLP